MTTMLINTTEGIFRTKTDNLVSSDPSEVTQFLSKNCTTYGMSIQYAVTQDNKVIEVMKRGKLGKKLVKQLIEKFNVSEWMFSWAFSGKTFELDNGETVKSELLDLVSNSEVLEAYVCGRSLDFQEI